MQTKPPHFAVTISRRVGARRSRLGPDAWSVIWFDERNPKACSRIGWQGGYRSAANFDVALKKYLNDAVRGTIRSIPNGG
jgi:hypothetical protein